MGYYIKSVIPIIESKYDSFTNVERNIADFFIKNRSKIDFSAKEVAAKLFVSEASLSRFAKKCGFRGYREFVYLYEENFVEKEETITGNARIVLNTYQELLNKAYNLVDEPQVARIAKLITKAIRVFACGVGSSGLAAREMQLRFMRIGVNIESIQERDLMRMQAVFQDKNCLVIGISISGQKEEVLYMLKEAHERKAKTIFITAQNKTHYEDFIDEIVLLPSLRHLDHGNVISPQFPILLMLDIWYSYYVGQDKYATEVMHDNTLKALNGEEQIRFY